MALIVIKIFIIIIIIIQLLVGVCRVEAPTNTLVTQYLCVCGIHPAAA